MKTAMTMIVVLFTFVVNASADPFADSKAWKSFSNAVYRSVYVAKYKDGIYVNSFRYGINDSSCSWIYRPNKGVSCPDFDRLGNILTFVDSNLIFIGATDTVIYTAAKNGFPGGMIRTVYCDKANGRLIVGTDQGVGISNVDAKGKPTTWTNALSVSIHQIVVLSGKVFAINNTKVYWLNASGTWDSYDGLGYPHYGDVDKDGNLWVTFSRLISGTTFEGGLAKFDGQVWKEYLVSTDTASAFGKIVIDKSNTLWYSCMDNGIGSIDLSTVTVSNRIREGTYSWNPAEQQVAISKDENGLVIFSGAGGGVYAIAPSAVRTPAVVRTVYRSSEKVVGTFDLSGRKIVNTNSFSSVHSSGMRFVAVQTSQGIVARKVLSTH